MELLTVDDGPSGRAQVMASAAASRLEDEGVDATWEVVSGPAPADAILTAAAHMGSGLIVLGTPAGAAHGHGLGRVARAVVRHSRRPVLLAPGPAA